MKTRLCRILIALGVLIAVPLIVLIYQNSTALTPEDLFDASRIGEITKIEFSGQQQTVVVTNKTLLELIETAFRKPQDHPVEGGMTYSTLISVKGGRLVEFWVGIYPSLDGFAVSLPRFGLQDPVYRNVSFQSPVDPQLTNLFHVLYEGGKDNRVIKF